MANGASSSAPTERLSGQNAIFVQSPVDEVLVSPSVASYLDPPPTYHHATGVIPPAATLSGDITEDNIPHLPKISKNKKWPRSETTTSTISTTTTTTTTTSRTTSTSTSRPDPPSRVPSSSFTPTRRQRSKSNDSLFSVHSKTSSDPYLDALLVRSIAALELSNALLQSTLTTKSTLSSVLASDEALEKRERAFEERLLRTANPYYTPSDAVVGDEAVDDNLGTAPVRLAIEEREGKKMEWMREMESIVRDVEALFDTYPSPPSTLRRRGGSEEGGLVLGDHSSRTRSPPPRALTQYVSITGANAAGKSGFATEQTADKNSIYLPSTTGLRRGAHREPLNGSASARGGGRRREGSTASAPGGRGAGRGHSPVPSTSSNSGVGRYLTASNSVAHPATHPEALPLSPQELLELHSESTHASSATVLASSADAGVGAGDTNDRHAYLRRFGAHSGTLSVSSSDGGLSGGRSASSTVSRSSSTAHTTSHLSLSPRQPASRYDRDPTLGKGKGRDVSHAPTPSTIAFTSFPSLLQQNLLEVDSHPQPQPPLGRVNHTRTESTATSHSATSVPTAPLSRSGRSPLSLGNLSFSLPLPSSLSFALRRSPSLRGMGSPISTDGSDAAGEGIPYSPVLEAIADFVESEDGLDADDARGRNWDSKIQSPTRGRAILRGRFRTADTLRRILDTSPSPRPALSIPPKLTASSPRTITSPQRVFGSTSRSNTDSSNKTITSRSGSTTRRTMKDSSASAESLALATPHDYTLENSAKMYSTSDLPVSSSIISSCSYTSTHSPSTVSSTSDLHSSDADGGRRRLFDGREVKRRLTLRPAPRFMPRTPSGRTAQLEVSGATARAPKMHAHLVELEDPVTARRADDVARVEGDAASGDFSPFPPVGHAAYHSAPLNPSSAIASPSNPSTPAGTPSLEQSQQERRRAQSLSASVASIINQKRALESMKLASAGKVRGGSNLKGSPAWKAQHKLHGSMDSTAGLPTSALNGIHETTGSGPSSKRTSWIGSGLFGLGLAISPSSSTNASTGNTTPPMRVSFAKEPVRYSEERGNGALVEDEEDEGDGGEAGINVQALEAEVEGVRTIKPRSVRRTKSWNGSVKGVGSRRVPSKKRNTAAEGGKEKKEGWLEWFLTASTAGPSGVPMHMSASGSSMGIGREEMFESRGRDDW